MDIKILVRESSWYPKKYLSYKKFPDELWYVGDISLLAQSIIGVVGPRKPSTYVTTVVTHFLKTLPLYNCVTISGGATGVDIACHRFCLEHNIPTIVVLGGSIDHAIKSTKRGLLKKIVAQGGLVLSQFPPGTTPAPWTYPQRNIVIALLSDVLFVPGGAVGSGTMSTLGKAVTAGIPVCTVPGPVFEESSSGTNNAIVENTVIPVDDFSLVFKHGNIALKEKAVIQDNLFTSLSEDDNYLLQLCEYTIGFEVLLEKTGWPVGKVISSLGLLEGLGYISQVSPGEYVKTIA